MYRKTKTYKSSTSKIIKKLILIFTLPFAIFSWIFYYTTMKSFDQHISLIRKSHSERFYYSLSLTLLELDFLANQLVRDPQLSLTLLEHPYYVKEGKASLFTHKATNHLIKEVYIYYIKKQPDILFSSSGRYSLETFLSISSANYELTQQEFITYLETKTPKMMALKAIDNVSPSRFFYLVPIPEKIEGTNLLAIYEMDTIDLEQRTDLSVKYLENYSDSFNKASPSITAIDYPNINKKLTNPITDKDNASTFSIINMEEEIKSIELDKRRFFLLFIFCFIFSLSAVTIFSVYKLSPIIKIESSVQRLKTSMPIRSLKDLHQILTDFFANYQVLLKKNKQQLPYAREHIFRLLLDRRLETEIELNNLLEAIHMDLQAVSYFILTIDLGSIKQKDFPIQLLEIVETDYQAYVVERLVTEPTERLVLVVGIMDERHQMKVVEALRKKLILCLKEDLILGVGSTVDSLFSLHISYVASLIALHHKSEKMHLIYYSDISNEETYPTIDYTDGQILKLTNHLKKGDVTSALEMIHQLISISLLKMNSLSLQRLYGYHLLNTIVQTGNELIGQNMLKEVENYVPFSNLLQLEEQLKKLARTICSTKQKPTKEGEENLNQMIIDYIGDHFHSAQISLASIAEVFNVSPSYISRMIRKEIGLPFSKYIQELRFKKIKLELIQTDFPIKEVIRKNGYYDTSNFTRKFRIIVGLTPGEYRKMKKRTKI